MNECRLLLYTSNNLDCFFTFEIKFINFLRHEGDNCTFISSRDFLNDVTALLTFTRATDGFRLEITAVRVLF